MKIIERTDNRYRGHAEGYTCLIQFKNFVLPPGKISELQKFWNIHAWLEKTYGPTILTTPEFKRNPVWSVDWTNKRRRLYLRDSSYLLFVRLAVPEAFDST